MSHPCVICDKLFEDKLELQEHFRRHATHPNRLPGKRPKKSKRIPVVECDVCDATFPTVSHAISHKFKHHGSNMSKHYCPWCGKQFTIKQLLNLHLASEHRYECNKSESEQKYDCDKCDAFFFDAALLNKHNSVYHEFNVTSSIGVFPPSKKIVVNSLGDVVSAFYCQFCGQQYVLKYNLQLHIKRRHSDMKSKPSLNELIKCSTCDAYFCNEKAFTAHNIFHRPEDLYVTSDEIRESVVTRIDQDFDLRRVHLNELLKAKRRATSQNTKKLAMNPERYDFSPPSSESSEEEVHANFFYDIDQELLENSKMKSLIRIDINNASSSKSTTNYEMKAEGVPSDTKTISKEELEELQNKGLIELISKNDSVKSTSSQSKSKQNKKCSRPVDEEVNIRSLYRIDYDLIRSKRIESKKKYNEINDSLKGKSKKSRSKTEEVQKEDTNDQMHKMDIEIEFDVPIEFESDSKQNDISLSSESFDCKSLYDVDRDLLNSTKSRLFNGSTSKRKRNIVKNTTCDDTNTSDAKIKNFQSVKVISKQELEGLKNKRLVKSISKDQTPKVKKEIDFAEINDGEDILFCDVDRDLMDNTGLNFKPNVENIMSKEKLQNEKPIESSEDELDFKSLYDVDKDSLRNTRLRVLKNDRSSNGSKTKCYLAKNKLCHNKNVEKSDFKVITSRELKELKNKGAVKIISKDQISKLKKLEVLDESKKSSTVKPKCNRNNPYVLLERLDLNSI